MPFDVSATTMTAIQKALREAGQYEPVRAALGAEAQRVLDEPNGTRWHPGAVANEVWAAIVQVAGPAGLEALNLRMTQKSFGPIVRPLLKVALALGGNSPATIFKRLGEALHVAMRGVQVTWAASGPSAGNLTFEYPVAMANVVVESSWRGVLRFSEELTGVPLRFDGFAADGERRFTFRLSW